MAFKELTVEEWRQELDRGLEFRKLYGLEEKWAQMEALFYHLTDQGLMDGPNLVMSTGDALLSALTVPFPYIQVRPNRPEAVLTAPVLESVDNMLYDTLKISDHMERASLSAFLWGRGFLKVGYDSEFGWDDRYDLGGSLGSTGLSLTQFNTKHQRIEFGVANPGMPWVSSVLPHDLLVPWGTQSLETAPWIAHRVVRHVDDIKSDLKYEHTRDLNPVMSMQDFVESYQVVNKRYRIGESIGKLKSGGGEEYCELWEIHDRRTGKIIVLATGHDAFLRHEPDRIQVCGLPFVQVGYSPSSRNLWVTPDSVYLLPCQAELTDITKQAQKQRRASALKFMYGEGMIDEEELENFMTSEVGIGIKVKGGVKPSEAITPSGGSPYNTGLYMEAQQTKLNAQETVGFSSNQYGQYQGGRRSATEAAVVAQNSNQRLSRKQIVARNANIAVVKKLNHLIWEFWDTPRVAEVVGPDGVQRWTRFTGEDLKSDYWYGVMFSSEPPETRASRREFAMGMFMRMMQMGVNPEQAKMYLLSMFNDPSLNAVLGAQQQQQVQQGGGAVLQGGGDQNAALQSQMQQMLTGGGQVPQTMSAGG